MTAEGCVKDIQVKIQNHVLYLSTFLLPIAGADLVLGASWLATLGPHVADFSNLTLKLYIDGKFVTLQGQKSNNLAQAQFHQLKRLQNTNAINNPSSCNVNHQKISRTNYKAFLVILNQSWLFYCIHIKGFLIFLLECHQKGIKLM